jgi:hypothetical protein
MLILPIVPDQQPELPPSAAGPPGQLVNSAAGACSAGLVTWPSDPPARLAG